MKRRLAFPWLLLLLIIITLTSPGQTSRQKRSAKTAPDIDRQGESECGVRQSAREFVEELKIEWRVAAETNEDIYYYNTKKMDCVKGILKAWIKQVPKQGNVTKDISPYSMQRVELNCRSRLMRMTRKTIYGKDGGVLGERDESNSKWEELIPDSVGETIWSMICHKQP